MKKKILFLFVSIICLPLLSGCDFNPIEFVKDKVDGVIDFFSPNDSEDTSSYTSDSCDTTLSTSYVVTYTVLWKDGDGNILEKDTVKSGDMASYDGEIPTKKHDNTYMYSFKSWDKEITHIYEDTVYNALFDKASNKLTIKGVVVTDCNINAINIIIPTMWKGNKITSIGVNAFEWCEYLTSITIPDSITHIGSNAFAYCDSLTSITIPDSVTHIGESIFSCCYSLRIVYCEKTNKPESWYIKWDEYFYGNVVWNCNSVIKYNGFIYNIVENNYITIIGYYNIYKKKLAIPNKFDGIPVISISDRAFANCDTLTSITIPNSVISIGNYAFIECDALYSITIPDSVTSIGDYAFQYCRSLTSITIPDSVTSIGNFVFDYCPSLTLITIPDSVTTISDYAFQYCRSLTSITIPDSITSIGEGAFVQCHSLTSITIPDSVTSIGEGAFGDCYSLQTIYCEALNEPDGWSDGWDDGYECDIIWGYTN